MHTLTQDTTIAAAHAPTTGLAGHLVRGCEWLDRVLERRRQRRALGALDGRQLADIGVSRAVALHESAKPFWEE